MRRACPLVLAAAFSALAATAALAQYGSVSLTWDSCSGDGGGLLKTFDCNTNSGEDVLVCSFIAPADVSALVGVEAFVQIVTCGQPSWWQLRNAGACRANAMSLDLSLPDLASVCSDPWQGSANGFTEYTYQYNSNYDYSLGTLRIAIGKPSASALALNEGAEYHAFGLIFNHQKAVGTATCTGCGNSAALHPSAFRLHQVDPQGAVPITAVPLAPAAWQAPGASGCIPDPVRNSTWGAVKSLYR